MNVDADALSRLPSILDQEEACEIEHVESDGVKALIQSQMYRVPFIHSIDLGKVGIVVRDEKFVTPVDVAALQAIEIHILPKS